MTKKLLSLLLAVAMLGLMGSAALAERTLINNVYTEGLPIVEEPETFSLLVDDSGVLEDKLMLPILAEQTGITPEFIIYPYQVALERLSIMVSTGDYPDAIGGWLLGDSNILVDGMVEGMYVPIEEYIDTFSPKMQEVLSIPGVRDTMTLPDGHIYTIPYVVGEPTVSFLPFINAKWLETLGLDMPETVDELAEVLRAFKTGDPNGNGEADEIPFSSDPNNRSFGLFAGWFGENAHSMGSSPYYSMDGDQIVFRANRPAFKAMIEYFAGLYAEGLIDPEIFTQDLEMWKSKGKQDLYGVSLAYGAGDFFDPDESLPKSVNRYPFEPLPVLKSEQSGDQPVFRRNGFGVTTFRTQLAITDKAKNPGLIVRWFDQVFQLDNSIQFNGGLMGVAMEKLEDGSYRALDQSAWDEATRRKNDWANLWLQSLPKYIPVDVKIAPAEGLDPDYPEKDIADAIYEPYLEPRPLPQVWMNEEDSEKMSVLQTDIRTYIDQKVAEWISGEKDINAEWDAYVAQLETMGLEELTAIKQRAVDSIPKD
ncbi:MAG: extracellular solute-binding protein [Oscillospiraceae bacterium]|nr:extracellular solute-binding protein [Oscillospiraceae bacterium]